MRIATPAFFCFLFAWIIFFYPLTFSLYVSLGLKWVSCRHNIYGSCFCIHSASLCLLVGAFNPFPFKVIINMYVPTTTLFIVLSLLLWVFSFSSVSCLEKFLYRFCKAGLQMLNSLSFCLSVMGLISPPNLNEILAG